MPLGALGAGVVAASALSTGIRLQIDTIAGIYSGERSKNYYSNYVSPNQVPSIDALIAARNTNLLDERIFWEASIISGVLPQPSPQRAKLDDWGHAWQGVIASTFYRPDPNFVLQAMAHGMCKEGEEDKVWNCYKFDVRPIEPLADAYRIWPTMPEAVSMWHRELITDERYRDYTRKAGAPTIQVRQDLQKLYQNRLTVGDYTQLYNRDYLSEGEWKAKVREVSGYRNDDMQRLDVLREGIPGPADLVRFAVREAFNDKVAERYGLDEEFEETGAFQYWMASQGLGFTQGYGNLGGKEIAYWPRYYWRSHWQLMSPTQCYNALHRLRPNRMHLYNDLVPGVQPFEFAELNDLLKMNDYVPEQRKWLAAISYSTPDLQAIRSMYAFDIIVDAEFIELMKDRGYVEEQAKQILASEKIKKPYKQLRYRVPPLDSYDKGLYNAILDSWRNGAITLSDLEQGLLGILQNPQVVNRIIATEIRKDNNKTVKTFTDYIRRSFFTGEVSATVALSMLENGGITSTKATGLVNLWSVQMDLPRRVVAAKKLVEWYRHGAITAQGLADRLQRLGYAPDTILLYLAEGQRLIAEDTAKRAIADEKAKKAAQKEAKARAKEQFAADNRYRTIAQITRWYRKEIITSDQLWDMLREMGVPQEDMDKHYEEIVGIPHVN